MSVCSATSSWLSCISTQTLVVVLQMPWIITLILWGLSLRKNQITGVWGKEITVVMLGLWLCTWQLSLYLFQYGLSWVRPNPFNLTGIYYGFPSEIGFYVGFGATFVIGIAVVLNIAFNWIYWAGLFVVVIGPAIVLCWFEFNVWFEVLFSMLLGSAITILFLVIMIYGIKPELPIILNSEPWKTFSCVDTWLLDERGHQQVEVVRQQFKEIDEHEN